MTAAEFRATLESLQMNGQQAAAFLRVSEATVSRYARGLQPISGPVAKLLEDATKDEAKP